MIPHAGLWRLNHDGSLTCLEAEQAAPASACKLAGQPTGFVVDPWQTLDRFLARAKVGLRSICHWIGERWQQGVMLFVFGLITVAVFAAYGHWSVMLWLEAIQ